MKKRLYRFTLNQMLGQLQYLGEMMNTFKLNLHVRIILTVILIRYVGVVSRFLKSVLSVKNN